MNAKISIMHRQLPVSLWVSGAISFFAKSFMQTPSDIFKNTQDDQWLADYLQCHLLELPQGLQALSLDDVEIPPAIKNWSLIDSLSKEELFVLFFCAEVDNHYWLNLALQELQGVYQDNYPKLHLLCDLLAGLFNASVKPSDIANWPSVNCGLLSISQQGPLVLSSVHLNQKLWHLLNKAEAAQSGVVVIGLQKKTPSLLPIENSNSFNSHSFNSKPFNSKDAVASINLSDPGFSESQLQLLDKLAIDMRLNKVTKLHLYASEYSAQAFVAALAERRNLIAIIPPADYLNQPQHLSLLAKAYSWLPIVDAEVKIDIEKSPDFHHLSCIVLHPQQDFYKRDLQIPASFHYLLQQNSREERLLSWQQFVPQDVAQQMASRWLIDAGKIQSIMKNLPDIDQETQPEKIIAIIANARSMQAPTNLQDMAFYVSGQVDQKSIVLNSKIQRSLDQLFERCLQREVLFSGLGSSLSGNPSTGVKALFSGESGTGKTLAATYLASKLAMPLYRMDLGSILNKYVGETEKNIHKLMQQTADEDFILLIDEADALCGKRTEAESGGERFANMLTNYLLARIEQHSGIVLMTTNGIGRIDPAFMRRFDKVIEFQSPELEERTQIWQSHLGERSPGEAVCRQLASLCDLTGGFIRNAVLAAAVEIRYSEQITLPYPVLLRCLVQEYRKSGKPVPPKLVSQLNSLGDNKELSL